MAVQAGSYPVTYSVDTPATLSRWLWIIKGFLLIPHYVVLILLAFVTWFTLLASWVAIVITGKRPRGLWDFHLGYLRWSARVNAYGGHLTDIYPSFSMDEQATYPVRVEADYIESASRLTTFFRYLLSIPHLIVLWFLIIVSFFAWFVFILMVIVTGKPHQGTFDFLVGVNRWQTRVSFYYWLLTDEYPPFSLD